MSGIEIETTTKKGFRLKLRIGNRDIEIHQEKDLRLGSRLAACKLLARSACIEKSPINLVIGRELDDESNVTLIFKAGYKVGGLSLGAQEAQARFSGQEAMDAFWESTDWITRKLEREVTLSR